MADKQFTLFELHFDGGVQIGPKLLGGDEAETEDDAASIPVESEDDAGGPGGALLALLGLVVLAAVARKVLGGDDDLEIETPDDEAVEELESA